jgi:hypothetical protein
MEEEHRRRVGVAVVADVERDAVVVDVHAETVTPTVPVRRRR